MTIVTTRFFFTHMPTQNIPNIYRVVKGVCGWVYVRECQGMNMAAAAFLCIFVTLSKLRQNRIEQSYTGVSVPF